MGGLISPDGANCLACGSRRGQLEGLPLCPACALSLVRARTRAAFLCPRCLSVLPPGKPCRVCARDPERLIEQTYAPYRYRGVPRALALTLKFRGDIRAAALLAPALWACLPHTDFDGLIPVPLSQKRLRERGYNQALELALLVSRKTGIPLLDTALTRTRATARQTDLAAVRARQQNVAGAFACPDPERVRGKYLLLLDDVRTTGATSLACARALRQAGAARVDLLAVCVAPGLIHGRARAPAGIFRRVRP